MKRSRSALYRDRHFSISHQPFFNLYQPSAISHSSIFISHQPSAILQCLSAISHHSSYPVKLHARSALPSTADIVFSHHGFFSGLGMAESQAAWADSQ
jgi:hypothetical protein